MSLKNVVLACVVALSLLGASAIGSGAASLQLFPSEQQAQQHCQRDIVVWLNLPSGIYHYRGQRWYRNTKRGAYVCEREAIAGGDRATRNGE
jgi:hypothetical protein